MNRAIIRGKIISALRPCKKLRESKQIPDVINLQSRTTREL